MIFVLFLSEIGSWSDAISKDVFGAIGMQVVQEVKELVKEGEGAISGAVAEFPGVPVPSVPSGEGLSPAVQAGAVAGAGVVGVLIASSVVNSLVSPAK